MKRWPGRRIAALLLPMTLLICASGATANHSFFGTWCDVDPQNRLLGIQYVPADSEQESYPAYLVIDILHPDAVGGPWRWSIYLESNGVEGLQRHDGWCYTPGYGNGNADTRFVWW